MRVANAAAVAMLAAVLGGILMPGMAQSAAKIARDGETGMAHDGHGMSGGVTGGSCAGMMQSMPGGERPNGQWRAHPPASGSRL
jgi:hypothetical protein